MEKFKLSLPGWWLTQKYVVKMPFWAAIIMGVIDAAVILAIIITIWSFL